jgi:hypothetical protein
MPKESAGGVSCSPDRRANDQVGPELRRTDEAWEAACDISANGPVNGHRWRAKTSRRTAGPEAARFRVPTTPMLGTVRALQ